MISNRKVSKIQKFLVLQVSFFLLKFVRTVFVGTIFVGTVFVEIFFCCIYSFITCNHLIGKTFCYIFTIFTNRYNRILTNIFFTHMVFLDLNNHTNIYRFSFFNSSYIFHHQKYIYICIIYSLLMLSILFCLERIPYQIDH